jgi:hypothetical protein
MKRKEAQPSRKSPRRPTGRITVSADLSAGTWQRSLD